MSKPYPIFVNLTDVPALVVGGGNVALRKIKDLLRAGARVFIIARDKNAALRDMIQAGEVTDWGEEFTPEKLDSIFLVVAATADEKLNAFISEAAKARQKLVNVVDSPALCNFTLPAVVERLPVQIAIGTAGTSPVLARKIKEKLEIRLPSYLGKMAEILGKLRGKIKELIPEPEPRRKFWEALITDAHLQGLSKNNDTREALKYAQDLACKKTAPLGFVSVVGAGPGDAGLITLKGFHLVQNADVVLYDALLSPEILRLVRKDAVKIDAGKRAGNHHLAQEKINALMIQYARQGAHVVRLKSGDPFIFGRGGEEIAALQQAGIRYEVVPGITAAIGAAALAGVSLTQRDYSQTVVFITGHLAREQQTLNWTLLAAPNQTLAIYMGVLQAEKIQEELIRHGRDPKTPVAVVSRGTWPEQESRIGVLSGLTRLAEGATSPAIILIGETVALQNELKWWQEKAAS